MLKEMDMAPDLEMETNKGEKIKLSDFRGKKVILYFYPKDNTAGCTAEACDFRDHSNDFESDSAIVIGVSKDSASSHNKFIEKYQLPFILVTDPELNVIKAFNVWQEKTMYGKKSMGVVRTTFIIDKEGKIRKIYNKVRVKGHVEKVLEDLKEI